MLGAVSVYARRFVCMVHAIHAADKYNRNTLVKVQARRRTEKCLKH